jgi:hypothetical protein
MYNAGMGIQQEVQDQIRRCVAGIPWVLESSTGQITPEADNVSTDELIHGVQLLAIEALRIADRLAGEIDQLRTT